MDTKRILDLARQQVPDLNPIGQNIYKGTLQIEDKLAGVYYFDLNNHLPEDFDDYQETLLSDEFYANPGNQQWNYYLFLLNDNLSPEQKTVIENNDRYARKFVFDEEEFADFFHFEETGQTVQSNIVTEWKNALDKADLHEVYSEETYVEIFDRFSDNKTLKTTSEKKKKNIGGADHIQFISRLVLKDDYRRYPKKFRDIRFGKVNLLRGINGVGKTSVFEAIELLFCGASMRNKDQSNPNGCIEAVLNNSPVLTKYQSKNTNLYQARDLNWYGTTNNRGNTLFNSFNRFNYFNADAAQNFSNSKTDDEIRDALFNIVLGPEFTYIQERCKKMFSRISPVYKTLRDDISEAKKEKEDASKYISSYKEPESLKFIRAKVQQDISQIGFLVDGLDFSLQPTRVEEENNKLQVLLSYFAIDNFSYSTKSEYVKILAEYLQRNNSMEKMIGDIKKLNHEVGEQSKLQKTLDSNLDLLTKCLSYLQDERFLKLRGINQTIREKQFSKQKSDFVKDTLEGIDLSEIKSQQGILDYVTTLKGEIELAETEKKTQEAILNESLEKLGKVDGLIRSIKLAGSEYLALVPTGTHCPMCQSSFERSRLEERINLLNQEVSNIPGADTIQTNQNVLLQIDKQLAALNKRSLYAERVKTTYQGYFGGDQLLTPVSEAVMNLKNVSSSVIEIEKELQELYDIEKFGKLAGKSEDELKSLENGLAIFYPEALVLELSDKPMLEDAKKNIEESIIQSKVKTEETQNERYAIGLEIKKLLGFPAEKPLDVKIAEETLLKQGDKLKTFERYFSELSMLVELKDNQPIVIIKERSDLLKENINSNKDAVKLEFEYEEAKTKLRTSEKTLKDNQVKFERFEKAFNTLKSLSDEDASEHLGEFFDQNFAEIIDIFKSIHVPKEFTNLKFEGDKIRLVDEFGEKRNVTEISTGQRSALALAIFLSLNRKLKNGPDVIMFDDPVAFIDDFNALSFLDYLRNYVLTSGKQIFFATANVRLAHLFEKKFSFLGDEDFVNLQLTR